MKVKTDSFSWSKYWSDKKCGGHRSSREDFLYNEAKEKMLHLNGGKSLLDFGCGSGDLLFYFAPYYENIVGTDFSSSMLNEAKKRLNRTNHNNIQLLLADEKTIWNKLYFKFDCIITSQVLQYFTKKQIDNFIFMSSKYLNEDGKIILFDIIDPKLYILWKIGFFGKDFRKQCASRLLGYIYMRLSNFIKRKPADVIGYAYSQDVIESIAINHNLQVNFVKSIYYEYRYHAIIKFK